MEDKDYRFTRALIFSRNFESVLKNLRGELGRIHEENKGLWEKVRTSCPDCTNSMVDYEREQTASIGHLAYLGYKEAIKSNSPRAFEFLLLYRGTGYSVFSREHLFYTAKDLVSLL